VFDFKTDPDTGQTESQETGQKLKFLSPTETETTGQLFVLCTGCLKYQNNFLSTKGRTTQNLSNTLNICLVLFFLILYSIVCLVLIFCRSNGPLVVASFNVNV
jgi:hypothetical protein